MNENNVNQKIKSNFVLLIDENGKKIGQVKTNEALNKAQNIGMDLVEVSSGSDGIPVCRIIDLGKWKYEQSKKQKKNKNKSNGQKQEVKELKFRPNTGNNDLLYRAKQADQFLKRGDKVKLNVRFKGREQEHMFITGKALLEKFLELISIPYFIESNANVEGNSITIILVEKNNDRTNKTNPA